MVFHAANPSCTLWPSHVSESLFWWWDFFWRIICCILYALNLFFWIIRFPSRVIIYPIPGFQNQFHVYFISSSFWNMRASRWNQRFCSMVDVSFLCVKCSSARHEMSFFSFFLSVFVLPAVRPNARASVSPADLQQIIITARLAGCVSKSRKLCWKNISYAFFMLRGPKRASRQSDGKEVFLIAFCLSCQLTLGFFLTCLIWGVSVCRLWVCPCMYVHALKVW